MVVTSRIMAYVDGGSNEQEEEGSHIKLNGSGYDKEQG